MTDDGTSDGARHVNRRNVLKTGGALTAGGMLVGCLGGGGGDGGDGGAGGDGSGGDGSGGDGSGGDGSSGGDGGSMSKVEEWKQKAKEEEDGQFKYFHAAAGSTMQDLKAGVEEEFPWLNLEPVKGSENIHTRFMSEYRAGNPSFDAVINDTALNLAFQDITTDLTELPNYAALPEEAKGGTNWGPLYYLTYTVLFNTDTWSKDELPTDWGGFLDDKFKGEMIMSATPKTGWMDYIWNNVDENYFQKLVEDYDLRLASGHGNATKATAAGERSINLGSFFKHLFIENRGAGAPVDALSMEPTMFIPTPVVISDEAPHPNTAKWFVNYLYSEEGIKTMSQYMSKACVGTINNIQCNPEGLNELANAAEPNLVKMFEPDVREEKLQKFKEQTGQ